MNIVPYIFYPLTIGLVIFTFAFFKYPRYAIAGLIIAKPIIDVTWDYHILLDINFLKLYAGLFVILGVIYIIVKRVPILTSRHINIPSFLLKVPSSVEGKGESTQTISSPSKGEDKGGGEGKSLPRTRYGGEGVTTSNLIRILWLIFLGLNFISIFIISDAHLLLGKINYFLRILTGFIALIMFAHLFDYEKDKKFVISIFIIAGIFPILLWLLPVILGNPILSNDSLRRIMGPYLNFWNFNFYAIQTLIFCLAYLAFSSRHCEPERSEGVAISSSSGVEPVGSSKSASSSSHCEERSDAAISILPVIASVARQSHLLLKGKAFRLVKRVVLYLMVLISIAMIYKCYSKAGWITLVVCLFVWFLLRRKFIFASLIVLISVIILSVNPFARDFQKTFSNEINYVTHADNTGERVFRGRLSRWGTGMHHFRKLPVINKLFGVKKSIGNPENDYLRVLWYNGFAGLLTYVVLLLLTGYFLLNGYVVNKQPVVLVGMLAFVWLIISSMGSYALYYPSQQWFMWGLTGFILSKDRVTVATIQ